MGLTETRTGFNHRLPVYAMPWQFGPMITDRVLFIDAEALVLDKPAGLAVHPGPATPYSLEALVGELRFGFARPPAPVHRLDRDTSGCLLLSRNPRAHRRLAALFEGRAVGKTYWAVVDGLVAGDEGTIDLPLAKISSRSNGWRMTADARRGKAAQTGWRVIERSAADAGTLVAFTPLTGRTHQIRVHAAEGLGVPIMGDPVYGGARGVARGPMLLHARRLVVDRGQGRTMIDVTAPLPSSFHAAGFGRGADDAD